MGKHHVLTGEMGGSEQEPVNGKYQQTPVKPHYFEIWR